MDIIPESKGGCPFCKRNMATLLCDCPAGVVISSADFKAHRLTCDKPICEKCATHIASDTDFCPDCIKRIQRLADGEC